MPFTAIPGVEGKVFVPEQPASGCKKHPCRDCFSCQMCSDERCSLCLGQTPGSRPRKDSGGTDGDAG